MNYNALLTTPKANVGVKLVVTAMITKSLFTYTNCGKTSHLMETCHNMKRKVLVMPIAIVKSMEPAVGTKTQLVKSGKIPICYPYIIFHSVEHK